MPKWLWMCIVLVVASILTYTSYFHLSNNRHARTTSSARFLYQSFMNKSLSNINKLGHLNQSSISLDLLNNIWMVQQELNNFMKNINKYDRELGSIKPKLTIIDASSKNYFDKIKALKPSRTVFFSLSKTTFFRVLGARIYTAHSNNCTLFTTKAIISRDLINLKCYEGSSYPYIDVKSNMTLKSKLLYNSETGYLNLNTNLSYDSKNSNSVDVGFMHLVKDAKLAAHGDIVTGKSYISITRCRKSFTPRLNVLPTSYEKVFTISQYWGGAYYHFLNEDLPRIVFGIPFLLQNKDVKVHVASKSKLILAYLADLGIDEKRIISGDVQAKTAYVPVGSVCGQAPIIPVNILSMLMRAKFRSQQKRDLIVLIKRSTKRWFNNHGSILKMLNSTANNFGLTVNVFGDKPSPSIPETQQLFNRAVAVVAPHGAGLSNIIFSEPGICVIEGLCYEPGSHKVNHCYKHLAQVLGHIYHGVVPYKQCMQIKPEDLAPSVDGCLNHLMAGPK